MEDRREGALPRPARHTGRGILLALFMLVAAGLVVYTAWRHDLANGLFAIAFSVLSARTTLSWLLWRDDESSPASPR